MSTAFAETQTLPAAPERSGTRDEDRGESLVLAALLFCSACIMVRLLWDISWHMSIGRDTLWSPPHVLEQIGASLAGIACGLLVLRVHRFASILTWACRDTRCSTASMAKSSCTCIRPARSR